MAHLEPQSPDVDTLPTKGNPAVAADEDRGPAGHPDAAPDDGIDYRVVCELASDAILVHDPLTGAILHANRQATPFHGYTPEELCEGGVGLLSDGNPPYDAEHGARFLKKAAAGEPQRFEWLSKKKSGERFWVEVRLRRVTIGGEPRVLAIITNIDERKRAEAALGASEESYRSLFDSLSDLVYIQDLEGRFVNVNEAVARTYGYTREELVGRTPEILAAPGRVDIEDTMRRFRRAVEGERQRFEWWGRRRNGSVFPKEVVLERSTYFGRDVVIAVARDISDRVDAETALRRSERQFRRMIENASDLIAIMDPEGFIRYQSPSSRRILGYEPEEMCGTNAFSYVAPEDVAPTAQLWRDAMENPREPASAVFRFRHRDGSYRIVEAVAAPLSADRPDDGVVVNSRDITARKEAEHALVLQNALLEAAWESSIDGILVVAADGSIQSYNQRFAEMWGIPDDVLDERSDERALQAVLGQLVDPDAFLKRVGYLYEHPDVRSRDTIELKDGRVLDRYTSPIVIASGEYQGRIWFFRDVTVEKRHAADLDRARREAESARAREERARVDAEKAREEADQYAETLERELEYGRRVQESLLPSQMPRPAGWDLVACFCPALQVAGDFYDAFELPGGHVGLMIADVSGKGVGAALFMALFQSHLRAAIERAHGAVAPSGMAYDVCDEDVLSLAVAETNDYMTRLHRNARMFASVFIGVLDPETGVLQYVNAGHEPPVVIRASGERDRIAPTGPAMGLMPGAEFSVGREELAPGDTLVTYTDGIPEARDTEGGFFGEERLLPLLTAGTSASALLEGVEEAVTDFTSGAEQSDDLTLLIVGRTSSQGH